MKKIRGIYKILNIKNKKVYIGQSINIINRLKTHKLTLKNNKHYNLYLQASFNKYGEENFKFIIQEEITDGRKSLTKVEQKWTDFYKSSNFKFGYNLRKIVDSNSGTKRSEESKKKMSIAQTGKKRLVKSLKKQSKTLKIMWSKKTLKERKEIGNKISETLKNNDYTLSSESIGKMIKTKIRNGTLPRSEETKKKIGKATKERKFSNEWQLKVNRRISEGKKKAWKKVTDQEKDQIYKKASETRNKNDSYKRTKESIQKGLNTKKKNQELKQETKAHNQFIKKMKSALKQDIFIQKTYKELLTEFV